MWRSLEQLTLFHHATVFAGLSRDLLAPQITERLNGPRAVPGVVIVGECNNLNPPLVNRLENLDPFGQFCAVVRDGLVPHFGLVLDSFPVRVA